MFLLFILKPLVISGLKSNEDRAQEQKEINLKALGKKIFGEPKISISLQTNIL